MTDEEPDPPVIPDPPNPNSILVNIKKLIGIDPDDTAFDMDVITHINSVFMTLNQLGVGPEEPFLIIDDTQLWTDFFADITKLALVKSYMNLKVRMIFDPPTSTSVLESLTKMITECEWRLTAQAEKGLYVVAESSEEGEEEDDS